MINKPTSKLFDSDYVLLNAENKPVESLEVVYAAESVIDLFNDGFTFNEGERFVRMTELPSELRAAYINKILA